MINDQIFPGAVNWHFADGMTVYSMNGEKVGTIRNFDPQVGYLDVQRGFLFKKDFYVPLSSVSAVDEDFITLKLTEEALEDEHYSTPPTVLADGSVMTDPIEIRKEPMDPADMPYERSTADRAREEWAKRPR